MAGADEGHRVLVVGDDGVGKTAFVASAREGGPKLDHGKMLIPEEPQEVGEGKKSVTVTLWDTVGSAEHERLRPLAYPSASAFILCFSVVNPASFENVREVWHPEVRFTCPDAKILLLGLKADLRDDKQTKAGLAAKGLHAVTKDEALAMVKEISAVEYVECTSTDEGSVAEVMKKVVHTAQSKARVVELGEEAKRKGFRLFRR